MYEQTGSAEQFDDQKVTEDLHCFPPRDSLAAVVDAKRQRKLIAHKEIFKAFASLVLASLCYTWHPPYCSSNYCTVMLVLYTVDAA